MTGRPTADDGPPPAARISNPGGFAEGLQAERTGLSWGRTAVGAVANAALLTIHELRSTEFGLALVPAALAVAIAAAAVLTARRRDAVLRRDPLPRPLAPRVAIHGLGLAVVVLALVTGVVLLL